jgi:hypothetical protein
MLVRDDIEDPTGKPPTIVVVQNWASEFSGKR